MTIFERLARRVPFLRYCILQHHLAERKKQAARRWEYRRTVYSVLGQTIATWAGIEMIIDHLIVWYHPVAGARDIQPDLPVTFAKKMDYLNKMARDQGWHDGGEGIRFIRTEAKRLNRLRKAIVHGVVWHLHPTGLDWIVQTREFNGPESELKRYGFKLEDLTEILSQMGAFQSLLAPRAAIITGLKPANTPTTTSSAISEYPISHPASALAGKDGISR